MNKKQLVILIAVALVLAVMAYLVNRPEKSGWQSGRGGSASTLIPEDFDSGAVARVAFSAKDKTVTLEKGEQGWNLVERYGYPANFSELSQFVFDLNETLVARELSIDQADFADLQLSPESGAVTVTFLNKAGETMQSLVFGKKHEQESEMPAMPGMMPGGSHSNPVGRYLILDDQRTVLAANTFALVDEPLSFWLDKDFFKISELKTASLSVGGQTLWSVERKGKSDALSVLGDPPEGKELDSSKLNSIKSAFSWIRFNDVADPQAAAEELGMEEPKTFTATDFDDLSYSIVFGEAVNGKRYLRISELSWNGSSSREVAEDEKPEDKERLDAEFAQRNKEQQNKAKELYAKFSPWTFEVGSYALNNVDKTRDELFKELPKSAAAEDADTAPPLAPAAAAP